MKIEKEALESLRIERRRESVARPAWHWLAALAAVLAVIATTVVLFRGGSTRVELATAVAEGGAGASTVLNATGYVTARRQATVSSKVTGKVTEVLIEEGQQVKEGDVLARLDDSGSVAELQLAEARAAASGSALEELRVRIAEAQLDLERSTHLVTEQVASKMDFDRSQAQLDALRARFHAQQDQTTVAAREVRLRARDLEDTVIRAPFDGVVVSKNAQPGEMISPISAGGGFTRTGICTIVDMDSLEVEVDVNESYITRVKPDQPVEIILDAYPDWPIEGHVITIVPTADRQKATVRVRIGFAEKDERILPDMGARVAFRGPEGERAATVVVPRAALASRDGADVVFVFADGIAAMRKVTVSESGGGGAELSAGVAAGEQVIVDPPAALQDGDRVAPARS